VLLIFPDGTGPALLAALIGGIPLNRVHELNFSPGEVRLDISVDNIRGMVPLEPPGYYKEIIHKGRKELQDLRSNKDSIVSVKDQKLERERVAIEEDLAKKREEQEAARTNEEAQRAARRAEIEEARSKEEAQRAARREAAAKGGGERQKRREGEGAEVNANSPATGSSGLLVIGGIATAGLTIVASIFNEADNTTVNRLTNQSTVTIDTNISKSVSELVESDNNNTTAISNLKEDSSGIVTSSTSPRRQIVVGESAGATRSGIVATLNETVGEVLTRNIDEDDGADAWIAALSEMMSEDENSASEENPDD